MDKLKSLEQLYISHNGIEALENLDQNTSLTTIDLASNRISKLDNLKPLENIEEFWFNDNLVRILHLIKHNFTELNLYRMYEVLRIVFDCSAGFRVVWNQQVVSLEQAWDGLFREEPDSKPESGWLSEKTQTGFAELESDRRHLVSIKQSMYQH